MRTAGGAIDDRVACGERFFAAEADRIARLCHRMAERFARGGRLIAFGSSAADLSDVRHVSVEFVHPVIVGKRALPALALTNNSAALSGLLSGGGASFARQIATLARPQDMALGFSPDGRCADVLAALEAARGRGMLTLGMTGGDGGSFVPAGLDFCFVVGAHDPLVVQETHETLYHVLWELVHIFFEHEGLLQ